MKKTALSVALAAPLALTSPCSLAQMFLNANGTGEALLFPFYSAANGNDTYIHIVNTTGLVKAAKVRFREAENAADAYSFNLYLSPYDHWSAAITADPDGDGAAFRTVDNTCNVPALGGSNPPFDGSMEMSGDFTVRTQPLTNFDYLQDAPNDDIERTLQGYIEVIEMGQLQSQDTGDLINNGFFNDYQAWLEDTENDKSFATAHSAAGIPYGCEKLVNAWRSSSSSWRQDSGD